jgi:chromosome segregation ATPase
MDSRDVTEIKRHITVVFEDVSSKMKVIAEGVSALDVRMGRVEEGQNRADSRLEKVDLRLGKVEDGQARLEGRLEKVETRLEGVEARLVNLEERLERGFAETQAMIKFSYAELDRRVSALESVVADLASRVQKLEVQ